MKGNRRRDTKPELKLRSNLHRKGLRYRVDFPVVTPDGLKVRPDIVFTRQKIAIFVDGCFFHSCPKHGHTPKTNGHYWVPKLERNRLRDARQSLGLSNAGWLVIRVWECDSTEIAAAQIAWFCKTLGWAHLKGATPDKNGRR